MSLQTTQAYISISLRQRPSRGRGRFLPMQLEGHRQGVLQGHELSALAKWHWHLSRKRGEECARGNWLFPASLSKRIAAVRHPGPAKSSKSCNFTPPCICGAGARRGIFGEFRPKHILCHDSANWPGRKGGAAVLARTQPCVVAVPSSRSAAAASLPLSPRAIQFSAARAEPGTADAPTGDSGPCLSRPGDCPGTSRCPGDCPGTSRRPGDCPGTAEGERSRSEHFARTAAECRP